MDEENILGSVDDVFSQSFDTNDETPVDTSQSQGSTSTKYFESDGEIGFLHKGQFCSVTNFSVKCTGYVISNENGLGTNVNVDGFLIDVVPKESLQQTAVRSAENGVNHEMEIERQSYYLTWKDMSTQAGIMNVIKSTHFWTKPMKDQYLPTYMKNLCDAYAASESSHRVFPIQGLGLQKTCITPTWVFGSNFQVQLCEGKATRLSLLESPCCNIGSPGDALPYFDISGDLDSGETLRRMILIEEKYMGENFLSSLLVLGGVGMAVHYEQLSKLYSGVPLVMAYGKPVSGKSTAVEAAMAVIGQDEKIGGK